MYKGLDSTGYVLAHLTYPVGPPPRDGGQWPTPFFTDQIICIYVYENIYK
jgi:hypothetical protein